MIGQVYTLERMTDTGTLDPIQEFLTVRLPTWSQSLHVHRQGAAPHHVDIGRKGALAEALLECTLSRGKLYKQLQNRFAEVPDSRRFGSAELRGATSNVLISVSVDDHVVAATGPTKRWGNWLSLELSGSTVEDTPAHLWLESALRDLVDHVLIAAYARGHAVDEFETKNIEYNGGARAVGMDISEALPGLYWLNFFGKPYVDLIGAKRILSAPARETRMLAHGIAMKLSDHPSEWATDTYRAAEERVIDHLGVQFFFSKHRPNQETVAPDLEPFLSEG